MAKPHSLGAGGGKARHGAGQPAVCEQSILPADRNGFGNAGTLARGRGTAEAGGAVKSGQAVVDFA
jgi:hypothetical protein